MEVRGCSESGIPDIGKRSCRADERESTGETAKRNVDRVFQAGRRKRPTRQSAQEIPVKMHEGHEEGLRRHRLSVAYL